jgi:hypothetical protein
MSSRRVYQTVLSGLPPSGYSGCIERVIKRYWAEDEVALAVFVHTSANSDNGGTWHTYENGVHTPIVGNFVWRFIGPELPTVEEQGDVSIVWQWDKAPGELRALSRHGGDEDCIILLPVGYQDDWEWLKEGCRDSRHTINDGRTVIIKAHA